MSSNTGEKTVVRPPPQIPRSVQVVTSPLRDDPVRAWTAVLLLGLASIVAGFVAESGAMGGISFLALAAAGWRLWAQVTYELASRGVTYTVLGRSRRIPWARIARHEERESGLVLYADDDFPGQSTFLIRWVGQREAILQVVNFYIQQRVSIESTRTAIDASREN